MLELTRIPTFDAVLAASSSVAPNKFPTLVEMATETANLQARSASPINGSTESDKSSRYWCSKLN